MAHTDHDVDLRTQPLAPEKSLGELVSDMTESLSGIFRKEVELAKVELKDEASRAGKGAGMLGGAAMAAWSALMFASFALAWLLDEIMHTALAFLLVAVLYGIAAAVLGLRGKEQLTDIEPLPETRASIQEDLK